MSPRSEEKRSDAREQRARPVRRDLSFGASRRTIVVGAVVGLPVSVALLLLSLRHLDTSALKESIGGARPWALALGVCAVALVYVVQAARWRVISETAPPVAWTRFIEWTIGAIAVNNVIPGRPGDLLRVEWLARGARMPRTRALASVAVDRGLDLLTLVVGFALAYPAVRHTPWLDRIGAAGGLLGIVVGVLLVAATVYARRARSARAGRVRNALAEIAHQAGSRLRGRRGGAALLLSMLAWGIWALSAWLVAYSLGITLTPVEVVFVTAVLNLGVAIPSSPGFIGTYQWLAVSALGALGVNHTEAFAFSVLMHAAWFVPTTLAGAALAVRKLSPAVADILPRRTSESHAA